MLVTNGDLRPLDRVVGEIRHVEALTGQGPLIPAVGRDIKSLGARSPKWPRACPIRQIHPADLVQIDAKPGCRGKAGQAPMQELK